MGKKSLSERIAEQLNSSKEKSGPRNKAIFIALKTDIEKAIADGWSLKQIWRTLNSEGSITFTYQTFRKYANALIRKKEPNEDKQQDSTPKEKCEKSGFQFNSKADKKDLL